jgi:two-component system nitrate/nitrite response regulator NarL
MRRRAIATILIGPSTLFREGLARILVPPNFRIIASRSSANDLDISSLAHYQSSLLVTEASDVPASEIEYIKLFKAQNPHGRIAILGNRWRASDIVAAFEAGANVYFAHVTASEEFLKAIELVMLGQTILPSELLSCVRGGEHGDRQNGNGDTPHFDPGHELGSNDKRVTSLLSAREKGVLRGIVQGASNKMIAREINISEGTVKVHVKAILRKIGVSNRTQAAIWAMTHEASVWASTPSDTHETTPISPYASAPPMSPSRLYNNGTSSAHSNGSQKAIDDQEI